MDRFRIRQFHHPHAGRVPAREAPVKNGGELRAAVVQEMSTHERARTVDGQGAFLLVCDYDGFLPIRRRGRVRRVAADVQGRLPGRATEG